MIQINQILINIRKVIKANPNIILINQFGLCDILNNMNIDGEYVGNVTYAHQPRLKMQTEFKNYLDAHKPRGYDKYGLYYWNRGNYKSRLNWLNRHIKLTNKS